MSRKAFEFDPSTPLGSSLHDRNAVSGYFHTRRVFRVQRGLLRWHPVQPDERGFRGHVSRELPEQWNLQLLRIQHSDQELLFSERDEKYFHNLYNRINLWAKIL